MKKTYLSGIAATAFLLMMCVSLFFSCSNPSGGGKDSTFYYITVDPAITGGTVTSNAMKATAGSTVTLTVTGTGTNVLVPGSLVVTKETGGQVSVSGSGTTWTFKMPNDDVTVTAEFSAESFETQYSIICTAVPGGSVTASAANAKAGDTITLTVTSNGSIWQFDSITVVRGVNTNVPLTTVAAGSSYKFTMPPADVTVTAKFSLQPVPGIIFIDGELLVPTFDVWEYEAGQRVSIETVVGAQHDGHSQAIRIGPEYGTYGGGFALAAALDAPINLDAFTALSLWVRSPDNARISSITVGIDTLWGNQYAVVYTGETGQGIAATDTWTQIIIPIPSNIAVTADGVLAMWLENQEGKILYVDDVRFISDSSTFSIVLPAASDVPLIVAAASTPISTLLANMKLVYTVDGKTGTLFNKNISIDKWFSPITFTVTGDAGSTGTTMAGANLTNTVKGGAFNLTVGFGGVTSAPVAYQISDKDILIIDNFTGRSGSVAGAEAINGGQWGWGQQDPNGYFGEGNIDFVAFAEIEDVPCFNFTVNNGDWGGAMAGRVNGGPWDLTALEYISFSYYTTTAGNSAVFGVQSGGGARDQNFNGTYTVNFTVLNAWTEVKITKAQLAGITDWDNITGWRFFVGGLGFPNHGGGMVYISNIAAMKD